MKPSPPLRASSRRGGGGAALALLRDDRDGGGHRHLSYARPTVTHNLAINPPYAMNPRFDVAKLPIRGSTVGSSAFDTPNQRARVAAIWSTEVDGNNRP